MAYLALAHSCDGLVEYFARSGVEMPVGAVSPTAARAAEEDLRD
jgi:hypothetical protein